MRKYFNLFYILLLFISSCKSINSSNIALHVAPSNVVLSFDDGPNPMNDTTARLLDVLKKHEIIAAFSLLGTNVEKNPELVRRIYDEGHLIVNHGYSEKFAYKMGDKEFLENLLMGETAINNALGSSAWQCPKKYYRPHGGYYTPRQERICQSAGYSILACSIRVYDAVLTTKNKDKAVNKVVEKIEKQNGGFILLHDARDSQQRAERALEKHPESSFNRSWFPEAVEEIIIALKARRFLFQTPRVLF